MMTPDQFWAEFCAATGHSGQARGVDQFGDEPKLADELIALVLEGTKRATCCLAIEFEDEPPPAPGDHWIMMDGHANACAIIRTTRVTPMPIRDVSEDFARIEGEGDKTLAWWKAAHDAYYTRQGEREGFVYSDDMIGLCEEFELVWPVTTHPSSQ